MVRATETRELHGERVAFLDVVRALATLVVIATHFRGSAMLGPTIAGRVSTGQAGVLPFFLASGFVIPSTLRRSGLRRFWVKRAFRLWPAYLLVLGAVLLLTALEPSRLDPRSPLTPLTALQNLLMLNFAPGGATVVGQSWTLGFELVFYAAASVALALGLLHRSALLAVVACATVLVLAAVPPFADHPYVWRGAFWLMSMALAGVVHDAWAGRLPGWTAWAALAAGASVGVAAAALSRRVDGIDLTAVSNNLAPSFVAGYVLFAVPFALARLPMPKALTWIGRISYSAYLCGLLVPQLVPDTGFAPLSAATWVAVTLAVGAVGFRFVEQPCMALGRRVAGEPAPVAATRG